MSDLDNLKIDVARILLEFELITPAMLDKLELNQVMKTELKRSNPVQEMPVEPIPS